MDLIDNESFEQKVLQSDLPCMVKFTSDWCKPCAAIQPLLELIAKELEGKVKIVKVDIDDSSEIASQYKVKSVPTMIVFKDGKVLNMCSGSGTPKKEIIEMFELK